MRRAFSSDLKRPPIHQVQALGLTAKSVTDIVLTHGDSDHVGGLADFPEAKVHLSIEEKVEIEKNSHAL